MKLARTYSILMAAGILISSAPSSFAQISPGLTNSETDIVQIKNREELSRTEEENRQNIDWSLWKTKLEIIAIILGGLWVLWIFFLERTLYAKIEFDVDLNLVGKQGDKLLVELTAYLTNKGKVRQKIREFEFTLLYLDENSSLSLGSEEEINQQVKFDKLRKGHWKPSTWNYTFIDAGVRQRYTYITTAPSNAIFLLLYSRFKYPWSGEFHTAYKVIEVSSKYLEKNKDC